MTIQRAEHGRVPIGVSRLGPASLSDRPHVGRASAWQLDIPTTAMARDVSSQS